MALSQMSRSVHSVHKLLPVLSFLVTQVPQRRLHLDTYWCLPRPRLRSLLATGYHFFKIIGTVRRAMKSVLELFCVIMVVCSAFGCSFPSVAEATGFSASVLRSARGSPWPASTCFGVVWTFALRADGSGLRLCWCSNLL